MVSSSSACCDSSCDWRLAQGARLHFQLLVVQAQLLLLVLQLLGLALRLLEQLFETGSILGGAHRDGERLGDGFEQLYILCPQAPQEAELDHRLYGTLDAGRAQQQLARLAATQRRGDGQMVRGQLTNMQHPTLARRFS